MKDFFLWPILFFTFELIIISYLDIRDRKISNFWSVLNILLLPVLFIYFPAHFLWQESTHWFFGFVIFFVGFLLYLIKIVGAGDVKLLVVFVFCQPTKLQEEFLLTLFYMTAVFACLRIAYKILILYKKRRKLKKDYSFDKIPYAPIILLSYIWWAFFL